MDFRPVYTQAANTLAIIQTAATLTIDLATNGALGLDIGVLTAGTCYAVWLLQGVSGVTVLASTSFAIGGVLVPPGYSTDYRYMGSFCTDPGHAQVNVFQQKGYAADREMLFSLTDTPIFLLAPGTSHTVAPVDCSAYVPPTANSARVQIETISPTNVYGYTAWGQSGSINPAWWTRTQSVFYNVGPTGANQDSMFLDWVPLSAARMFEYFVSSAAINAYMQLWGYGETL